MSFTNMGYIFKKYYVRTKINIQKFVGIKYLKYIKIKLNYFYLYINV